MTTQMLREIAEIPQAARRLSGDEAQADIAALAERLRDLAPPVLLTVARGSSDHAASYLSYAFGHALGLPVASVGPSLRSVWGRDMAVAGTATLAISQSGASHDIADVTGALRAGGSLCIAVTDTAGSPLAEAAGLRLATLAGVETAVAATKSLSNSILAGLWLAAHWARDPGLKAALEALPGRMEAAFATGWPELDEALAGAETAVVLGRGAGLGLAAELALKLQETCGIFAVPYSAAEFLHGPIAMLEPEVPVLALTDGASTGIDQALGALEGIGARVLRLGTGSAPDHPLTDPMVALAPLYRAVEAAARARGLSPDTPRRLRKETVTV